MSDYSYEPILYIYYCIAELCDYTIGEIKMNMKVQTYVKEQHKHQMCTIKIVPAVKITSWPKDAFGWKETCWRKELYGNIIAKPIHCIPHVLEKGRL